MIMLRSGHRTRRLRVAIAATVLAGAGFAVVSPPPAHATPTGGSITASGDWKVGGWLRVDWTCPAYDKDYWFRPTLQPMLLVFTGGGGNASYWSAGPLMRTRYAGDFHWYSEGYLNNVGSSIGFQLWCVDPDKVTSWNEQGPPYSNALYQVPYPAGFAGGALAPGTTTIPSSPIARFSYRPTGVPNQFSLDASATVPTDPHVSSDQLVYSWNVGSASCNPRVPFVDPVPAATTCTFPAGTTPTVTLHVSNDIGNDPLDPVTTITQQLLPGIQISQVLVDPDPPSGAFHLKVEVRNASGWTATGTTVSTYLKPSDLVEPGDGGVTPASADIAPDATQWFDVPVLATGSGGAEAFVHAAAIANGAAVSDDVRRTFTVGSTSGIGVSVQTIPAQPEPDQPFEVDAMLTNLGQVDLVDVSADLSTDLASADVSVTGPTPSSLTTLPAGGHAFVSWQVTVAKSGDVDITVDATGTEESSATTRTGTGSATVTVVDPLGVDWTMPDRLSAAKQTAWGQDLWGLPPASYVNPTDWTLDLFLTREGEKSCPDGVTYKWEVTGQNYSLLLPDSGCTAEAKVPHLGVYDVKATELKDGVPTGRVAENSKVVARDWLIAGFGDSNGSGEGNPPFFFPQCDRSLASSQYLTAQYVEDTDPRSSVTFLFTSCSGARTDHLTWCDYAGIQPDLGAPLPPQFKQVLSLIGDRHLDTAIMSIGVNDLAFGEILKTCTDLESLRYKHAIAIPCPGAPIRQHINGEGDFDYKYDKKAQTTLASLTQQKVNALPTNYSIVADGFEDLTPDYVFITQYPDFMHDQNGDLCSENGQGFNDFPHFYRDTWGWLDASGDALNANVAQTTQYGWKPVTGIPEDFLTHGYCSSDSYFVHVPYAKGTGQLPGAFHPTADGQLITYRHTKPDVCEALYDNAVCDGLPPAS